MEAFISLQQILGGGGGYMRGVDTPSHNLQIDRVKQNKTEIKLYVKTLYITGGVSKIIN